MTTVSRVTSTNHFRSEAAHSGVSYEVQHGDSLHKIAAEHGLSLQALLDANPQVRNPDVIYPGDRLILPGASAGGLHSGAVDHHLQHIGASHGVAVNGAAAGTIDLRHFTDPALGSNAPAAIVIGNAEGTRRPDGSTTAAFNGHTDPGNAVHNRGSFSYQHTATSAADADRRQLATLQGRLPAYEAAARNAGLDPNNARLASAYLDLYNQSPSAAARFLGQLGTLRGQPLDAARITQLRVNSFVDASTGQRFALAGGGQAGSGFVNIARHQLGRTPTEAQVQGAIRADQQRRTNAMEAALSRQGLLTGTAVSAAPATAVAASAGSGQAARILDVARGELGTREIRGSQDSPRVLQYHQATTLKARNDETSWCSSFVNWTMKQSGIEGTHSAAARSWLGWGTAVPKDAAHVKPGDVIVFPRGNNPAQGHVAIVEAVLADGRVKVIGGNQGNGPGQPDGVNEKVRPLSDAIGVRRAP